MMILFQIYITFKVILSITYCRLGSASVDNWSEVDILKLAAGVESSTIHPIGKAIVEAAKAQHCPNVKVYALPIDATKRRILCGM